MTPGFKPFNFLGCVSALGVGNGEIPDAHITASSKLNDNNGAALARLRLKKAGPKQGGWSALYNDFDQWIQVDLGGSTRVTRVATQGKNAGDAWVVKYRLQYSEDLGMNFSFVKKSVNSSAKVCVFFGSFFATAIFLLLAAISSRKRSKRGAYPVNICFRLVL